MLHELVLYLSSADGRRSGGPDHRRAGRVGGDDHPAHPVLPDPRPAPPPRAARPDRPLRHPAPGPPVGHPAAPGPGLLARVTGRALRRPRRRAVPRRGPRSPRNPGRGDGRHDPAADTGTDSAELYGFAELQAGRRRAGVGARPCSRSCPRPSGTRARLPRPTRSPGRAVRARYGRTPVPDPTAVALVPWREAAQYGAAVAVTTRYGGVSEPPYGTLNLGLHVGDRPGDVVANRARAAAAFGVDPGAMVFARQVHGTTATLVGPDRSWPRHRVGGRRRTRHRHPRDDVARASPW